jgi:hypothetical protein
VKLVGRGEVVEAEADCGCECGKYCPHDCCKPKQIKWIDGSIVTVYYYPVHFRTNLKEKGKP